MRSRARSAPPAMLQDGSCHQETRAPRTVREQNGQETATNCLLAPGSRYLSSRPIPNIKPDFCLAEPAAGIHDEVEPVRIPCGPAFRIPTHKEDSGIGVSSA